MSLEDFSDEGLAELYRRFRITANRIGGKSSGFRLVDPETRRPRDWIDAVEGVSDGFYYHQLVEAPFFGGMKAKTVEAKLDAIHSHLGNRYKTAGYGEKEVARILSDPNMIKNRKKVEATVNNATAFIGIEKDYGSFGRFLTSYGFYRSHENLLWLHHDIMSTFEHFGSTNAWFYLMMIGLPGIKARCSY